MSSRGRSKCCGESSVEIQIPRRRGRPSRASKGVIGSPIDVEEIEDDVQMLSAPRGFPRQRNRSRRKPSVTVDLEEEEEVKEVGANEYNQRKNALKSSLEPVMAVPLEPTFTCPVCLNPLVEASSTICGHVFCGSCIKASIEANKKCPICTRDLMINNFHRVYLPAAE